MHRALVGAALVFAPQALAPAQQPVLRCRVVDAAGRPQPGLRVLGTLRVGAAEPQRAEAVTTGDDAVATFAGWCTGDGSKGAAELTVAMVGAAPRTVVDLARAGAEAVTIALPPAHALLVDLRTADGGQFPEPLRAHFEVTSTGNAGERLKATTDAGQRARLFPIACGAAVHLQCVAGDLKSLDVPAWNETGEQTVPWPLPADLVIVLGKAEPPPGTGIESPLLLQLRSDRGGMGIQTWPGSDGRFAAILARGWIGAQPEVSVFGKAQHSELRPVPAALVAGINDIGSWTMTSAVLLVEGDLTIDGVPAPADTPLLLRLLGVDPLTIMLPTFGRTDGKGHFAIQALVPPGVRRVAVVPGGALRVQGSGEFDVGARGVALAFASAPALSVEVLLDDPALANGCNVQLARDGHEYTTLLTPKAGAANGCMTGLFLTMRGGTYRQQVRLAITDQLLFTNEQPIEIEHPTLAASRPLPPIDLRGKLSWLRLHLGERARGSRAMLLFRAGPGKPWQSRDLFVLQLRSPGDERSLPVAGPIDVAILGDQIAYELFPRVERQLDLVPKPAPTITVRLDPAPSMLPKGWRLSLRGECDALAAGGEFDLDGRFSAGLLSTEAVVAADGTATVSVPLAVPWHLQLVATNVDELARGSTNPVWLGGRIDVELHRPAPAFPLDVDELSRVTAPKK